MTALLYRDISGDYRDKDVSWSRCARVSNNRILFPMQ